MRIEDADDFEGDEISCSSAPLTNEREFELHRAYLQLELERAKPVPPRESYVDPALHHLMWYGAIWMGRYMRRRDAIEGTYDGALADVRAKQLLVARHRARDAADKSVPEWDPFVLSMMNRMLQNAKWLNQIDVSSFAEPHGYGPSLRSLWAEVKRLGRSDLEAWEHLIVWGRHRPACWDRIDARKQSGQPLVPPDLVKRLARELVWQNQGDLDYPWAVEVKEEHWRVRLNDFPDDFMYSLLNGDEVIGDFHDWPPSWHRD
jgi:hypothetical protein